MSYHSELLEEDNQLKQQQKSIMLIEDNAADVALIQENFQKSPLPYKLLSLSTGESAIELLNQGGALPDLALIDISLPKMSGFQTLKLIRETPKTETLPVLILTASDDMNDVIKAQELGANGYIVKPMRCSLDELLQATDSVKDLPGAFVKVGKS